MRLRIGTVAAFAAGYYLGARAGRERYEQIRKALDALPLGRVLSKAQAVGELALERVRPSDESQNVVPFPPASNGT
jgi:hypothetical protein